jgi:hypothetical protein
MDDQGTEGAARAIPETFRFYGWSDPAAVEYLRACWAAGLSAAAIARRMIDPGGVQLTKNAIISKAHRIGCEARESPIVWNGPKGERPAPPPEPVVVAAPSPPIEIPPAPKQFIHPKKHAGRPPQRISIPLSGVNAGPPPRKCRWPRWKDRPADRMAPQFCDEPVVSIGKPYCACHSAKAFVHKPLKGEHALAAMRRVPG